MGQKSIGELRGPKTFFNFAIEDTLLGIGRGGVEGLDGFITWTLGLPVAGFAALEAGTPVNIPGETCSKGVGLKGLKHGVLVGGQLESARLEEGRLKGLVTKTEKLAVGRGHGIGLMCSTLHTGLL